MPKVPLSTITSGYGTVDVLTKKEKQAIRAKRHYEKNKEEYKARASKWQKENNGKYKEIYKKCVSSLNGKATKNTATAKRRAAKLQATPPWADLEEIKNVYLEAQYFGMHVDHIIPLQHPLVCGLHIWENLQLLSPAKNLSKGNTFNG